MASSQTSRPHLPLLFHQIATRTPTQRPPTASGLPFSCSTGTVTTLHSIRQNVPKFSTRIGPFYPAHPSTSTPFFSSMAAYLWLIWYDAATKVAPKHWTLAVSYELHDCAYATVYEVTMDITGRYQSRVVRRVHLTGNHPSGAYGGKILLGEVNDGVLCALEAYSESAAELVNTHDRKRGAESSNCHDWATIIVRSLEDAMLLPKGSLARVEKCPRLG